MTDSSINKNPGSGYALITGASGGLGISFAMSCARRGYNLFLLGLPGENVENLCDYFRRNFPVEVTGLEIDLSEATAAQKILDTVLAKGINLEMLINNAGMSQNDYFEDSDGAYMRKMIESNSIAVVSIIKALLPELKKNKRSHIINVSSLGSFYALPRKSAYAATKGFVRQFSQALRIEIKKHGVVVSILCPGAMTTNVNNYILHRQLNWISKKTLVHPRVVAEKTIKQALKGKEIIIPGRFNRVLKRVTAVIPGFLQKRIALSSMKQLEKKTLPA